MLIKLARKSLLHRKATVLLTVVSISISIMLLISINFINNQAKSSFSKTISGIDLIIGSKTSDINLLLYSVFHIGSPTNNIQWDTYDKLNKNKDVKWTIPISLGDSHRGFRVIGTDQNYYDHFKYGSKKSLKMISGKWFKQPFEVVIGKNIADKLNYNLNDSIILSHGISKASFTKHDQFNFKISGILKKTGTPVDRSLYVSLTGLETIHLNWPKNKKEQDLLLDYITNNGLTPKSITATYLALENKSSTFVFQRKINEIKDDSIQAVLPGVALAKIWNMSQTFEQVIWLIGALVFLSTLVGLVTLLIASLQSRKRELALLRMIGASPMYCFLLIQAESLFILLSSMFIAFFLCLIIFFTLADWLGEHYGLFIEFMDYFNVELINVFGIILITSICFVCIPSLMFYKQSIIKSIN